MNDSISLVETTWAKILPMGGLLDFVIGTLLVHNPELKRTLFARVNRKTLWRELQRAITDIVRSAREPDTLMPMLKELGLRHARYGCRAETHVAFREALLFALEVLLKEEFTVEVRAAWNALYDTVEAVMVGQLETAEGQQLLSEYEAKYPSPYVPRPRRTSSGRWSQLLIVAVPVVIVGSGLLARRPMA